MRVITRRTPALFLLLLLAVTACTYTSKQNPRMAAASAAEFAKVAFVDQNIDCAFGMLDPEFQQYATKEKFAEIIATMNRPTAPKAVAATEFGPIRARTV